MKNQFSKLLIFSAMLTLPNACGDGGDAVPDPVDIDSNYASPVSRVYILNEGIQKANNSTLDVYCPSGELPYRSKIFAQANGEALGDTGESLIAYGGRLYLSVNGSKYLAKLDGSGHLLDKHEFSEQEGEPRQIAASDGFVYVTLYSGHVAKFDTASLQKPVAMVEVGSNPEGICISGGNIYVANSGWGMDNRLSVIDLQEFKTAIHYEVENNLQDVKAVGDSVYATYYKPDYSMGMANVDISKGCSWRVSDASKMAIQGDYLYCANSAIDWASNTVSTSFYKRNAKTGQNEELLDIAGLKELNSATVYLLDTDPISGDIYVGVTDYVTPGTIYRFDSSGKFISKFGTSAPSPSHIAVLRF